MVSLVSSPGSGKTAFLEKTLTLLRPDFRVAALVGDLATENDAARLARSGAPVKQITTGTLCHLEAAMVRDALNDWATDQLDFLFVENVGNLVCPSSYDLGEDLRLVLVSTRKGDGMNDWLNYLASVKTGWFTPWLVHVRSITYTSIREPKVEGGNNLTVCDFTVESNCAARR